MAVQGERETIVIGTALGDAKAGEEVSVSLSGEWGVHPPREERWSPADLDRCEHGRHSIDHCSGCGGMSSGNLFLEALLTRKGPNGERQIRIGTMVRGEPIWITPKRESR